MSIMSLSYTYYSSDLRKYLFKIEEKYSNCFITLRTVDSRSQTAQVNRYFSVFNEYTVYVFIKTHS